MKPVEASLKALAPDHWDASEENFFYSSVLWRYGCPMRPREVKTELLLYIREHCASMMRMMRLAISAYESLAENASGSSSNAFLFLTAGCSALDAMACVLAASITGTIPKDNDMPGLPNVARVLKDPVLVKRVQDLRDESWCKQLYGARNKIVHRGYWLTRVSCNNASTGIYLTRSPGLIELRTSHHTLPHGHVISDLEDIDLAAISVGLLTFVEKWQFSIVAALDSLQQFESECGYLVHRFRPDTSDLGAMHQASEYLEFHRPEKVRMR